ncbi:MAG: hypothetical protein V2A62_05590 [Candidatus Woesearchaeota archaeon]
MNRKGMVFFWILLIIMLGVGISFMVNYNIQTGEVKGVWSLSYVRAFQESEKDLLFIDNQAILAAKQTDKDVSSLVFSGDLGCGIIQEVPLWNQKDHFCPLKMEEKFSTKFNSLMEEKGFLRYNLSFKEGELIGKINQVKTVTPANPNVLPTERKSASLFTSYNAYLIKPFGLWYYYNPSFRVKVNLSLSFYSELQRQAQFLVHDCQNEVDLKSCLEGHKNESWNYGKCNDKKYAEDNRKVLFCVNKLSFGLDFSPQTIFSPKDTQVSLQGNQVKVSFTPVAEAENYKLYYTNWDYQPDSYPQEAKSLFFASQGSYFYATKVLNNPTEDNCPTDREANTAYRCSNQILYWLEDVKVVLGQFYYLTVTAVKNEEESLVYEVLKLDSSQ